MQLARILGTATATVKHPTLASWKLLVAQPLMADGQSADGAPILVVDRLGAGRGDTVIVTSDGRSTREMLGSENSPVRWATLGIADE